MDATHIMTAKEHIAVIDEAISEARRLNAAAGHTVFNPAALDGLRALRDDLEYLAEE